MRLIIFTLAMLLTKGFALKSKSVAAKGYEINKNFFQSKKDMFNNQLNKGLWIKNKFASNSFEKPKPSNYIFHNSLDTDVIESNFDKFQSNALGVNLQELDSLASPFQQRVKRSVKDNKQLTKPCKNKSNCIDSNESSGNRGPTQPILSNIKPAAPPPPFDEYPYRGTFKLDGTIETKPYIDEVDLEFDGNQLSFTSSAQTKEYADSYSNPSNNNYNLNIEPYTKNITFTPVPSDSMPLKINIDDVSEPLKIHKGATVGLNVAVQKTEMKVNEINDDENYIWENAGPRYIFTVTKPVREEATKIIPTKRAQEHEQKNKTVIKSDEKSLVTFQAMLMKTFMKVMKQHEEIKQIRESFTKKHEDFNKNIKFMTRKFQDFDKKYNSLLERSEKINDIVSKLSTSEQKHDAKEKDLLTKLQDHEMQQKKFLVQQKQFYDIQRLILSQNERISQKQSFIAQTQSNISQRQAYFTKVLKKAKQMYLDTKKMNKYNHDTLKQSYSKLPTTEDEYKVIVITNEKEQTPTPAITTTQHATKTSTDSVKINLFSIPVSNQTIPNQDDEILKEKDIETVDDLVYKFYFNNTFIDSLLKTGILANIVTQREEDKREAKIQELGIKNTLLFPLNKIVENDLPTNFHNRNRRWINHHERHAKRKHNVKSKPERESKNSLTEIRKVKENSQVILSSKIGPFLSMAKNFCNQIQQNSNKQVLNWCIEKAIRRLQNIDLIMPETPDAPLNLPKPIPSPTQPIPTPPEPSPLPESQQEPLETSSTIMLPQKFLTTIMVPEVGVNSLSDPTRERMMMTSPRTEPKTNDTGYFPDNEELELNLQQYEIKPDLEGNVYYDGSVHASDIVGSGGHASLEDDNEGASDIMPGMDSNSRADIDPRAIELQAKRREYVRQLNANILNNLKKKVPHVKTKH